MGKTVHRVEQKGFEQQRKLLVFKIGVDFAC